MKKSVAGIVTEYRYWSHADIILGKLPEGYLHDGGAGPDLHLTSLFIDQFPANDTGRDFAKKHGIRIFDTIEGAVTLGTGRVAVDGVLIIGEHGKYPTNARGQILYPRRRFFAEVADAFARYKRVVPVFTDKHLAASWEDAKWVYDRARELFVPLMAGSSVPVAWRRPLLHPPRGTEFVEAVQISYGPLEGYTFHALEGLQCLVERRKGGETGVKAVQFLRGGAMWQALDAGRWSKELLDAAVKRVPAHAAADIRATTSKTDDAGVILIEYRDGLRAAVPILNGWLYEGDGGAFCFAGRVRGQEPVATHFYLQQPDPFAHFSQLLKAIESMVRTNHPAYPVERTLLTTGVLDAAMTSRAEGDRRVETPHLEIRYQPTDWPPAPEPPPKPIQRPRPK